MKKHQLDNLKGLNLVLLSNLIINKSVVFSNQTDFRIGSWSISELNASEASKEETKIAVVKVSKTRLWLWRARSQAKIKWELFVLLLALWNLFYVPYNFAFNSDLGNEYLTDAVNIIIDLLFMMDVFVNFRTTLINEKTGEEITDGK